MRPHVFGQELTLHGVRIKLIQQNDLGSGKIRLDFARGVEKVYFFGTLRQEGIKKAFFRVNFICIERDSSPCPNRWRVRKLCGTPFFVNTRRRASAFLRFFVPRKRCFRHKTSARRASLVHGIRHEPRASGACGMGASTPPVGSVPARLRVALRFRFDVWPRRLNPYGI